MSSSLEVHVLQFRDAELTSNNTRYDNLVAGGSDEQRIRQWTVYSSVALVTAAFVLVVLVSILRKRTVRNKSFNLFLVFLMIPDFVFSFLCGLTCALNAANGEYVSATWCNVQVFYCVWGIGANAWLNAAVARHLHRMLLCNQRGERYFPPTRKRVVMESLIIYAWLAFVASWTFIDFLPHEARLSAGLACLPHEYDTSSTLFQWLVFVPLFALIPTGYALYVAFDVFRRKLLPPNGRKRELAIYFFRLVVVFLAMWLPSIFLMFVAGGHLPSWVSFLGGVWSHLQGAVSAFASILKRDIQDAFLEFITCGHRVAITRSSRGSLSILFSQQARSSSNGEEEDYGEDEISVGSFDESVTVNDDVETHPPSSEIARDAKLAAGDDDNGNNNNKNHPTKDENEEGKSADFDNGKDEDDGVMSKPKESV